VGVHDHRVDRDSEGDAAMSFRRPTTGVGKISAASAARRVFFSFHYQRDINRVNVVKDQWVAEGTNTAAGFFTGSLEEEAQTKGVTVLKHRINDGMNGSSVLCVLIGAETYTRRWVHYEIFQAIARGMGVFGINVHSIADMRTKAPDVQGINPFAVLGCGAKERTDKLWPVVWYADSWKYHSLADEGISRGAARYLPWTGSVVLSNLFAVYDWAANDGPNNLSSWVRGAARQAGG
jgi:hypothetical protein